MGASTYVNPAPSSAQEDRGAVVNFAQGAAANPINLTGYATNNMASFQPLANMVQVCF